MIAHDFSINGSQIIVSIAIGTHVIWTMVSNNDRERLNEMKEYANWKEKQPNKSSMCQVINIPYFCRLICFSDVDHSSVKK